MAAHERRPRRQEIERERERERERETRDNLWFFQVSYLYSGLVQVDSLCKLFPRKYIRILGAVKCFFQSIKLSLRKCRSVAAFADAKLFC